MSQLPYILFNELNDEQNSVLLKVKYSFQREYKPLSVVKELIQLGLIAGDYTKLYVTDKGDEVIQAFRIKQLARLYKKL